MEKKWNQHDFELGDAVRWTSSPSNRACGSSQVWSIRATVFSQKPSYTRSRLPVLSAIKLCPWNASESCRRRSSLHATVLSLTKLWQHITAALIHLQWIPVKSYIRCKILLLTDKSLPAFVSQSHCIQESCSDTGLISLSLSLSHTHGFSGFFSFSYRSHISGNLRNLLTWAHLYVWLPKTPFSFSITKKKSQSALDEMKNGKKEQKIYIFCAKSSRLASESISVCIFT